MDGIEVVWNVGVAGMFIPGRLSTGVLHVAKVMLMNFGERCSIHAVVDSTVGFCVSCGLSALLK